MTEAQKEYIITEEEMAGIEMYPYDPVTRMVAFKAVRSRPYKSDAVLDELRDWMLEMEYTENHPLQQKIKRMKTELRQKGRG